jgi:hypothetical protein
VSVGDDGDSVTDDSSSDPLQPTRAVLHRIAADVFRAVTDIHHGAVQVSTALIEGPLAGGIVGTVTGRTFVAVGPTIEALRKRVKPWAG